MNITGARGVLAENSLMLKRALAGVLGFLSLCLSLAAQQTQDKTIALEQSRNSSALDAASALTLSQSDIFGTVDSSILIHGLPVPILTDGRHFPVSGELARMGMMPVDLFPIAFLSAVEMPMASNSPTRRTDSPGELETLRLNRDLYSSGEMGFSYGTTIGKFGYETKQGYIMGTVGNDKFQITAGASYQESSFRIPRQSVWIPSR
jgi:hypothetical protein